MELRDYLGDTRQLGFIQTCRLSGGKADGVEAAVINNGCGLHFMVLSGRAMDIPWLYVDGKGLHYTGASGITASPYYEKDGNEWLRGFFAGALTTCGITFAGQGETDQGEALGLHGRISHTPAEDVRVYQELKDQVLHLAIEGTLREVKVFGTNMVLHRRIETDSSRKGFTLTDRIINQGSAPSPLMMMYHINFGYPFLNPDAGVLSSAGTPSPGNDTASSIKELQAWKTCCEPEADYPSRLYYHHFPKEEKAWVELVKNRNIPNSQRVRISFDPEMLPSLVQWKLMQRRNYVMGLEPCTVIPKGRAKLRDQGLLPHLEPDEQRVISIDYDYVM